MCQRSDGNVGKGERRIKRQRFPRPGITVGFSLSQTLNTPRCSLLSLPSVAKQRRRKLVRKVTKINKGETPPPTTWPKA